MANGGKGKHASYNIGHGSFDEYFYFVSCLEMSPKPNVNQPYALYMKDGEKSF